MNEQSSTIQSAPRLFVLAIPLWLITLLASQSTAPAQDAPASWSIPGGQEVAGSVFVTRDTVHVLDWKNQVQVAIARKTLPKQQADFATRMYDEVQAMLKPFDVSGKKEGEDFVRGTFKGKMPYDIAETSTCTMIVDGQQRVQHYGPGKRLCKVENFALDNKRDGIQLKLYPTGEICKIFFFNRGVMEGPYISLYRDGSFLDAVMKSNGKSADNELTFHQNGILASVYPCADGVYAGETKHFDLSGKLYGTQMFVNNKPSAMKILRELKSEDELRRVTAQSDEKAKVARFGELWKSQ